MTTLLYNIQTGANGSIVIPTTPFPFGKEVEVVLRMPKEERQSEQTEEQRKAAGKKFFETWDRLLEGMPDMTAKEIFCIIATRWGKITKLPKPQPNIDALTNYHPSRLSLVFLSRFAKM